MAEKVTVACKLPNGIILRLFNMVERQELLMGGGTRTVAQAVQTDHAPVTIKGCAMRPNEPAILFGGYALTEGVDKDFWAEWLQQNKDSDIVKNRLIFAHDKAEYTSSKAKEASGVLSGLQPLEPDADARSPKRVVTDKAA